MVLDDGTAALMIRVDVIGSRDDDVGVNDQGQDPNPSASISSSSAARRPLVEDPSATNPS